VLDGRASADLVVVAVEVLSAPMLVTGSSVTDARDVVEFPGLRLPDGEGRNDVAIVLPWMNEGRVTPGR
jgi:hypothetical protein